MAVETRETHPHWLTRLRQKLRRSELTLAVGLPKNTPAVTVSYHNGEKVLDVAVANEYGTDSIPARPAIHNANGALQEQFKQASEDWQIGQSQELMERFSPQAIGIVQQSITNLRTPPNAPSTQRQKGSSNPLIDTGLYRQSINADIREN